jgi:hypothetical protein
MRAHSASILGYAVALAFAVALAVAVFHREPTYRRTTWCPDPEHRTSVTVEPAVSRAQVVARLREIHDRLRCLAPPALDLDSPPAVGSHAELDGLIRDLISDLSLADTPTEPSPP